MPGFATGLEASLKDPPRILRRARFGLVCNQASVDADFRYAHDLLAGRFPGRIAALFGPQHGLWSTEQDNMIETAHAVEPRLRVPVHSLYSETRKPTPAMLQDLDLLVVDLPDVGTRIYTYAWTLTLCMEACAEAGIPVLVLDRPNPLGGELAEGPSLDPDYASFVGRAAIPMRHGLTIAELAAYLNEHMTIGADLHVVEMRGWKRDRPWPELRRAWVPPSPNLPRFEGAQVYPGQVLWEGTALSEGRGTTTPFEMFGAPWLEPHALLEMLQEVDLPGVALRPVRFEPTFHKFTGEACGGLFLHVTDAEAFRPYRTTLALLRAAAEVGEERFAWRPPPYEYEHEKQPIDILTGGAAVRRWIEARGMWSRLDALSAAPDDWWSRVAAFLRYS